MLQGLSLACACRCMHLFVNEDWHLTTVLVTPAGRGPSASGTCLPGAEKDKKAQCGCVQLANNTQVPLQAQAAFEPICVQHMRIPVLNRTTGCRAPLRLPPTGLPDSQEAPNLTAAGLHIVFVISCGWQIQLMCPLIPCTWLHPKKKLLHS